MSTKSLEAKFDELIAELANSAHGSAGLSSVKKFLDEELKGTDKRASFILPKLLQEAIVWEGVKDLIWQDERTQEQNKFPFLQGDVIDTKMVLRFGNAETSQEHATWLVLSPDCDCVRARFIRVAPVFPVYKGGGSNTDSIQRFGHSLKLATPKIFPLDKLPNDIKEELRGYFADFDEPFYIKQEFAKLATPYASMTVTGWHLLNAIIQEKETRAVDIKEAVAIRSKTGEAL